MINLLTFVQLTEQNIRKQTSRYWPSTIQLIMKRPIRNNQGSTLLVSCLLLVVLTIIAGAYVLCGTTEGKIAQRYDTSTQAFWLAEAAVEVNKTALPGSFISNNAYAYNACATHYIFCPDPSKPTDLSNLLDRTTLAVTTYSAPAPVAPVTLGNGTYDTVCYQKTLDGPSCTQYQERWDVVYVGKVNNQFRIIRTVFAKNNISGAIAANGPITQTGSSDINGPVESNASITFDSIFGMSKADVKALAGTNQYTNGTVPGAGYSGISYITTTNSGVDYSGSNGIKGSGLLIIDCGSYSGTCMTSKKGTFSGVIWVVGSADFTGSSGGGLTGAVFVEGTATTTFTGNSLLTYDEAAVTAALGGLPGGSTTVPAMVSWNDI